MKRLLSIALLMCFSTLLFATHNRAGEIIYEQIGPLTFKVTIITYTKTSAPADRDTLRIEWGDGTAMNVARSNGGGQGENQPNDIKYNIYVATHTYPGRATYTMSVTDQNRNANILNVNAPNSQDVAFHLETKLTILNPTFDGFNTSPILLQPPIDIGCVGERFVHNPNAFDVEGDSVAYELIKPLAAIGIIVPNYVFPDGILPGANNTISLNPRTGDFIWNSPQRAGEYNVAFLVKEYRSGRLISTIIRDIQITIRDNCRRPPQITTIDEKCVIAGETITFNVRGEDPDTGEKILLSATGGPLQYNVNTNPTPATFNPPSYYKYPPIDVPFTWRTPCESIREQYYQIVFRAVDNSIITFNSVGNRDTTGLADLKAVRIRVVGPPVKNLTATPFSGRVELEWDKPYKCEGIGNNRFKGFNVWRRDKCAPFQIDTCGTDLRGQGFVKIKSRALTFTGNRYTYSDNTVERGKQYSYVITAEFTEVNSTGFPINEVEGLPSNKICVQVARDLPLMTNADVKTTSTTTGSIFVQWSKPYARDLDTLQNSGGYQYALYRAVGNSGGTFQKIWSSPVRANFWRAVDTNFTDINLNTTAQVYRYRVALYVKNTDSVGVNSAAASHYLTVASTDRTNNLSWTSNVPWTDSLYEVWRKDLVTGIFNQIGTSLTTTYSDGNLTNGTNYCYKIKAIGSYNTPGVLSPLINWSQEACGVPLDSVPPCPPVLTVVNDCASATSSTAALSLKNTLRWQFPTGNTACWSDVASYNVYYSPTQGGTFTKIAALSGHNRDEFLHELIPSLAGCYYVTAIDSVEINGGNNESRKSNIVCVDNCPIYALPNVFTPNNDGMNDTYTPYIPYRYISRVNIRIFNRWGGLLYQSSDPMIQWDGRDLQGNEVAEGAYFYECTVWENRLEGEVQQNKPLTGFIQLIRGK